MTTDLDRIAEALRQADAAGDVEGARKLASYYRQAAKAAAAAPDASQPGRLGSFASSVGRGALSVVPGTIGGIGYLTGQEGLVETAEDIEGGINRMLPVNPAYENEFLMKAGGALGQAGGMLLTGGVTGAAGKALAASRGLQTAQAAAKGTQLARNVLTGTGVLQGARGGGQAAEQYGMQGGTAYARALLGGAIEGLSERALFGMGTELAPVKKFLGDAAEKGVGGIAKAAGTEAGEEAAAQIGGNLATSVLAPYGVQTPGALEGAGEAALLGGIAGGALGGVNALMQPSPTIEGEAMIPAEVPVAPEQPEPDEFGVEAFRQEMAEIAQNPDPIVPLQTAVNKTAEASVMQNADVLPATAAVIAAGGLNPAPAPAPVATYPAASTPTDRASSPAPNLPPRATEAVPPRPQRQGRDTTLRDAWDEQYGNMRKGGRSHNDDGSPYQPTLLDEVLVDVQNALYGATDEEKLASIGDQGDASASTTVMRLLNDGWVWDTKAKRLVNPANPSETPLQGVVRIRKQRAAPVVEAPAPAPTLDQVRARLRQRLSDEERAAMEQRLVQAVQETSDTETLPVAKAPAATLEPFADSIAELQRLAPEQPAPPVQEAPAPRTASAFAKAAAEADAERTRLEQEIAAQETPAPLSEPTPIVEETPAPVQPIPAVEEAVAPETTPEQVQNVENVIDDTGAAEVGSGMEKKAKSFKNELEMSGVAYLNGDRWGIKQSSDGTFYVEQTVNGERKIVASNFPDIETAQVGAISAAFYPAVEPTRATVTPDQTMEEGRIPRDETPPQGSPPTDKALVKPVIRRTGSKVAGASVAGQQIASANASRIATLKMLNDAVGAYPNEDFSGIDPSQINEVMDYMISLQLPQPIAPAPTVQRDVTKPEQMTPEERGILGHQEVIDSAKRDYELAKTGQTWGFSGGQSYKTKAAAVKDTKALLDKISTPTESDIKRGASDHYGEVNKAVESKLPVSAAAVDAYKITLPEGYVRQGDLFVFQPQPTTPSTDATLQREIPENRVQERQAPDEGGPTPEAGGRNIAEKGGTVSGEEVAKSAAEVETLVAGVTAAEVGAKMEELLRAPTKATGKPAVKFKTQTEENAFRRGFQAAVDKPGAPPPADKTGLSPKDRKWDDAWRTGWVQGQTFVRSKTPTQPTELGSANTVVTKETKDKSDPTPGLVAAWTRGARDRLRLDPEAKNLVEDFLGEKLSEDQVVDFVVSSAAVLNAEEKGVLAQDVFSSIREEGYAADLIKESWSKKTQAGIKDFGSTNKVVTKETKDKAAKSLRKKLGGQTNVGLDPSILKDAVTIGAFYIEGGARSFADFSAKMIEEFGAGVQKYLRPAYEALRKRTDIDTTGMDPEEQPETATTDERTTQATLEDTTPSRAPTERQEAPAVQDQLREEARFPTEIKLTEQPERPQAPVVPPDDKPVGFSNAEMDAEAERIVGRDLVRPVQEAISDEALWAQATAEFKRDPESGRRLVSSLTSNPRAVNSKEQAMLGMELVRRKKILNEAAANFNAKPEGDIEAKSNYETAQRDYDDAMFANSIAGGDTARALRFRRLTANLDMELAGMLNLLRAVGNKADISKDQVAQTTEISEEYKKNRDELDALRKKIEERDSSANAEYLEGVKKAAFEEGFQTAKRLEAERVAEMQQRKAEYLAAKKEASKTPNRWEEIRAAARARKAELRSNLYSDVVLIKAASMAVNDVIIGATYIAEGVTKFADWVVKMRGEDINLTDDEMQQLFKESKAFDSGEELPVSDTALKTRKAKAPAIDKVKAIAADEEALDSRTIYNLVVEKVTERSLKSPNAKTSEMTDKDLEAILREVTEEVREYFPNVTEREIRDLFSGYGRIILPSQDDIRKQTRQLSALGKLASAIEDAKAQRAPLKSGPQRDKATQAIRLKQKELARELRMMSVEYAAGEEQLRSPLDAMKARVNNQISDLDYEIRKGRKNRRPTPDPDPELKELISLRDELKRISDFVNAPAGPTFAELVEDEMKKLDKRIEVLQQALKSRQFMPKQDNRIYTEELQVKRDERDRLSKLVAKARKQALGDPRTQDEIDRAAIKDAQDAIVELNRKIAEKDFSKPERRTPTETAEYQRLINEKQALQKVLSSMRQEAEGRQGPTDEQRIKQATEAIDASIARMEKMISSGNIDAVKRVSKTPETPELAQKREMRKNLRKQLLKLRKLKRDALIDPIAKQIATDKKRIQTRMDKLKKRMDERDFSKPVKREKPTDPALLELLAKEEELKEKWGEMLLNHKLSQRSKSQKAWAAVFDLFSMGRFLKASTDLSAIANQGNFALFSHPVLSMRQLGGMWEAMKSDKNQKMLQAKIRELPEYKSGEMKRAGLYLAMDAGPNDPLQRQEEAMAARWVDKLPGLPGRVLRATSRAYTSYLDLIRVATYLSLKNNLVEGGWFMQPQETTPERLQSVASLINNGTGRGSLGTGRFGAGMNQAAPFLNTFMFAPRFAVSRFAMSLGVPLWTASKGTKRLIAIEYAKYLSGLATAMFLYSMLQDEDDKEMEFDPTSSDFGKVIFDNQRVDVMGGFQQPLVFLLRVLFGEYKNTKGELKALREKDRPLNLFRETPRTDKPKFSDRGGATVVGDFLRYKLSPTASLLLNTIEGKTPVGERTDLMSEIITMPVPLILGQLTETAKAQQEDPFMALLLSGSGIIGVRTSNQDPNVDKSKAKTAWEQLIDYTKYYSGVE